MLTVFNQSLWGDEAFSAILSMKPLPELIKIISHDTSPPLWNLFEWTAFKLFGTGEVVIRSLSLFFFLIACFFAYKLAKHFWDQKTALFALALTFFNPFFFSYAFEGRMYSIMAAGVAASMYFFAKKKWAAYVAATLFALYSHHFAIFAVFIQGLWFIYEFFFGERKTAISIFKSFIAIGIGYSPWLWPLYIQTKMVGAGFWLGKPTVGDLTNLFSDYLGTGIKHPLAVYARDLILFALLLRIWTRNIKKYLFLLTWFAMPILLTWIVSQKFTPIFYNRYLLYTIPAGMILLASERRKFTGYLLIIIIAAFAIIDWHYFVTPAKIPFRELATYVKSTKQKGDLIINEDAGNHKLWESKYYGIPAPIYNPTDLPLPYFVGTALMEKDDFLIQIPKTTRRIGVITYKNSKDADLRKKFNLFIPKEEMKFGNLYFIWMTRK